MTVKFKKMFEDVILPTYVTEGSAGMDLRAYIEEDVILLPKERMMISTGLQMALPEGYEAQIRPRSGMAIKHGITVINSPATIDSDYRGEIKVCLVNLSNEEFVITHGMRIAQMVIAEYAILEAIITDDLDETDRGEGGFGSTGLN